MLASAITLEHRSPVGFGTKEPASRSPVDAFSPPSSRYPGSIPIKVYLWCIGRELVAKKIITFVLIPDQAAVEMYQHRSLLSILSDSTSE